GAIEVKQGQFVIARALPTDGAKVVEVGLKLRSLLFEPTEDFLGLALVLVREAGVVVLSQRRHRDDRPRGLDVVLAKGPAENRNPLERTLSGRVVRTGTLVPRGQILEGVSHARVIGSEVLL